MTLQQFRDKYLGKQVEYHSFGGSNTWYQCVDLVNQYIKELGLTPIIGTDAKDFKDKFNKDEFEWIPNDPNNDLFPKRGDIVVWNGRVGGGAGHIAIALDNATLSHLRTLDQNWSQKQRVTIENHNYNSVSGWLRPKGNMSDDALKACLADREKFWKERDEARAEVEALNTQIAGFKSRITDLGNQLGKAQAEANNANEHVSRLEKEVLAGHQREELLATQLNSKQIELEEMARSKGVLATELAQAKEKITTLEAEKGQGEYTITIGQLIKMILNQKIVIRRS